MNLIIKESKLSQVVFLFLNNEDFIIKETPSEIYFLYDKDDKFAQIVVRKNDSICLVSENLIDKIKSIFGHSPEYLVKLYVQMILGIRVEVVQHIYNAGRSYLKVKE